MEPIDTSPSLLRLVWQPGAAAALGRLFRVADVLAGEDRCHHFGHQEVATDAGVVLVGKEGPGVWLAAVH